MEKRRAPRRRVLKAGTIDRGGDGIDCTVHDLSEIGAGLEVASPLFVPDSFTLVVKTEKLKHPSKVAWRKKKRLGVEFK